MAFLVLASLFFYGWWEPRYLAVILTSISANYLIGRRIISLRKSGAEAGAKRWLVIGIALNLAGLVWFKYTGFLLDNLRAATDLNVPLITVVLPLAISFFTFQQIAY